MIEPTCAVHLDEIYLFTRSSLAIGSPSPVWEDALGDCAKRERPCRRCCAGSGWRCCWKPEGSTKAAGPLSRTLISTHFYHLTDWYQAGRKSINKNVAFLNQPAPAEILQRILRWTHWTLLVRSLVVMNGRILMKLTGRYLNVQMKHCLKQIHKVSSSDRWKTGLIRVNS